MQASISTAATAIGAALATLNLATDNASSVKFSAVLDFAVVTAADIRRALNRGDNLARDAKGRYERLIETTRDANKSFKAALIAGSVSDKDAGNIASLATTAARHFVAHMIDVGSLHAATGEDNMRDMLAESFAQATGGAATYNALEKARSRKWLAPEPVAEDDASDDSEDASGGDPFAAPVMIADTLPVVTDDGESEEPKIASDYYASALFTLQSATYGELSALEGFDDFVAQYMKDKREAAKAEQAQTA